MSAPKAQTWAERMAEREAMDAGTCPVFFGGHEYRESDESPAGPRRAIVCECGHSPRARRFR